MIILPIHYDLDAYDDAICLNYHEKNRLFLLQVQVSFCSAMEYYTILMKGSYEFSSSFISLGDKNKPLYSEER